MLKKIKIICLLFIVVLSFNKKAFSVGGMGDIVTDPLSYTYYAE